MSEAAHVPPRDGEVAARSADGGGSPPGAAFAESPLHQPAAGPPARTGEDLKADFPGLRNPDGSPWHYLDSAATAQKPQVVIDAVTKAIGADYATVHRGVYTRSAEMTLGYEAARRRVAAFIGGSEDEVVFTRGATEAINLVAYSYPDRRRVLLSELEHHSNIVPWQLAGWQVDVCPLTGDGQIDLAAAERMLTREHTMVAFAHVSNVLGSVLDVRRAAELAHSVGAKLLLDGCQAVPRLTVDVAALDCDFYAFSGHKLYGPTGIGALWSKHLDAMPPWQGGGAMIERVAVIGERDVHPFRLIRAQSRFAGIALACLGCARHERRWGLRGTHSIPSSSRASSLILAGSHGGSHTRLTSASRTPGTVATRSSTSPGIDSATGQCGVVSVIVTTTSASGLTWTP